MCTNTVFDGLLVKLDNNFSVVWDSIEPKIPREIGVSYGSCFTSCGSVGITDVTVSSYTLDDMSPKNRSGLSSQGGMHSHSQTMYGGFSEDRGGHLRETSSIHQYQGKYNSLLPPRSRNQVALTIRRKEHTNVSYDRVLQGQG